jgi:GTP-binding protein HflX
MLVGVDFRLYSRRRPPDPTSHPDYTAEESLEELAVLAASAGAKVLECICQRRPAPDAATLIGSGKVGELRNAVKASAADVVLFDRELSPTQLRNLERSLNARVVDRTQLILDIFARRAHTREGQLQVELAQLNYLLPRLTGRGTAMSRLGGGIGTRGPGEQQLETDRRRIYRRLRKIEQDLESVRGSRSTQRKQRQAVPLATVALVGYTNAGKSTLFNRLTGSEVTVDERMFATLDPTVRVLALPSRRRVLLSDTVGFIRNLPTTLVKAFRATLEEVTEALLLLHVVDASSPHSGAQTAHVQKVLEEIGAGKTPQILVRNKLDLLAGPPAANTECIGVSARTGTGIDELTAAIDRALPLDPVSTARYRIPVGDGAPIHLLHELARVLSKSYEGEACVIEAEVPESLRARLAAYEE